VAVIMTVYYHSGWGGVTTPLCGVRFPHRLSRRWFSRKIADSSGSEESGENRLHLVLAALLDSTALDAEDMAQDCLEVFDQYDWQPAAGVDQSRFDKLLSLGLNGDMTQQELEEFVGLVSFESEKHLFWSIQAGKRLLNKM
jgi:hypothetical protein